MESIQHNFTYMNKINSNNEKETNEIPQTQSLTVFNIQKFSIHDGDGIRTTIFFKGCPLHCAWCHNPESQCFSRQLLWNRERCTLCGACAANCPQHAVAQTDGVLSLNRQRCTSCGSCEDICPMGAREIAGKPYTVAELVRQAKKDQVFYETSGGGVTLSGGEVMSAEPFEQVVCLCEQLHRQGISVYIDTSGCVGFERFASVLPYADVFLYDIKAMDPEKHSRYVGGNLQQILSNLKRLSAEGARIRLRLPLVAGVNDADQDILPIIRLLQEGVQAERIHLLPYHNTGKSKYARLEREEGGGGSFAPPSSARLAEIAGLFRKSGFSEIQIGG